MLQSILAISIGKLLSESLMDKI